jgi:hypothetical protein
MRKYRFTILAGIVLALAATTAASATPAHARNSPVLATLYSTHLAGHITTGTNRLGEATVNIAHLPDLTAYTGPPGTIAAGITIAQNSNGGTEFGIGVVWDDPASTCLPNQWTLAANPVPYLATGPVPVPIAALAPLMNFGADVCLSPGAGQTVQVFYATRYHEILFANGTTPGTEITALVVHNVFHSWFATGLGITTTNGADAAQLALGTVAFFNGAYIGYVGSLTLHPFNSESLYAVEGTVTGGAPSVSNPLTLVNGASGINWTVSVP